jgi:hypothetical protein
MDRRTTGPSPIISLSSVLIALPPSLQCHYYRTTTIYLQKCAIRVYVLNGKYLNYVHGYVNMTVNS